MPIDVPEQSSPVNIYVFVDRAHKPLTKCVITNHVKLEKQPQIYNPPPFKRQSYNLSFIFLHPGVVHSNFKNQDYERETSFTIIFCIYS
ncbi:hypothetical protein Hanom_Chr06g00513321 [Helianthus anomalus]